MNTSTLTPSRPRRPVVADVTDRDELIDLKDYGLRSAAESARFALSILDANPDGAEAMVRSLLERIARDAEARAGRGVRWAVGSPARLLT